MKVFVAKNQIINQVSDVNKKTWDKGTTYAKKLITCSENIDLVDSLFIDSFNKSFTELTNLQNYLSNNSATG